MVKAKILIIDDEESICSSLTALFESKDIPCMAVQEGIEALGLLTSKKKQVFQPDVILLDIQLPDMDGMMVLERIKKLRPEMVVLMITGHGTISQSVEAMHKGAADYILKPFNVEELLLRIEKAQEKLQLERQVDFLSDQVQSEWEKKYVLGPNKQMKQLYQSLEVIAQSPSTTVFIQGETGTGKEVIAQRIHTLSQRRNQPFVEVNATALTAELLESELFGHEQGSFTGATNAKRGLFEVANGGTLFLDEIGDMDLTMQAKILRAIQERTIRRVGGTTNIPVDLRLVTATNKDLAEQVREGKFREDLYYRLTVVPVVLPPLRDRLDDLETLILHFVDQFNKEFGRRVKSISPEAMDVLQRHSWPGNVRELRNLVERTVLLECHGEVIEVEHLKFADSPVLYGERGSGGKEEKMGQGASSENVGSRVPLEVVEREHIQGVLTLTKGNKNQAAQILGIDRTTLYNKLKKYQI